MWSIIDKKGYAAKWYNNDKHLFKVLRERYMYLPHLDGSAVCRAEEYRIMYIPNNGSKSLT